MIRVLIADDEELIRDAVAALLELEDDLEVVARSADGPSAVEAVRAHRPDVAVVDFQMPGLDGLEVAAEVTRVLPSCAVVILTGHAKAPHLQQALLAGAKAFLPKGSPGSTLAHVIRVVHGGRRYVDPGLAADALAAPPCPLTRRELEILRLVEFDTPVALIARRANLSPGTIRNHLSAATSKLGAKSRNDAVRIARENGWL